MRLAVELYGTVVGTLQGDARTFDCRFDGHAAQVVRGQRAKGALKTAHGRAGSGNDDDGVLQHGVLPKNADEKLAGRRAQGTGHRWIAAAL